MENQSKANIEHALKWGLILGMVNIAIYLLCYVIDKNILTQWWLGVGTLVINITLMIIPVTTKRKELGGLISFKDAFIICFVVLAGGALLQSVFNYVLYNLIDPSLSNFIKEKTIETTANMMEKFGAPQEQIDKTLSDMQNQDMSQNPARIGQQYLVMLLINAVISSIIAAIFKKNPKVTDFE